jgi:alkanesulfonate monooxygenase SsuD/methylene tetrahydromethanopterin reductase-like flavin-dependent oxidoreductase (luciferase family)
VIVYICDRLGCKRASEDVAEQHTGAQETVWCLWGFREFIESNIEAEALGFHSTFVVEHHFADTAPAAAPARCDSLAGAAGARQNPAQSGLDMQRRIR